MAKQKKQSAKQTVAVANKKQSAKQKAAEPVETVEAVEQLAAVAEESEPEALESEESEPEAVSDEQLASALKDVLALPSPILEQRARKYAVDPETRLPLVGCDVVLGRQFDTVNERWLKSPAAGILGRVAFHDTEYGEFYAVVRLHKPVADDVVLWYVYANDEFCSPEEAEAKAAAELEEQTRKIQQQLEREAERVAKAAEREAEKQRKAAEREAAKAERERKQLERVEQLKAKAEAQAAKLREKLEQIAEKRASYSA